MKTIYKGDTRYEKVYEQMQLLGIQDVSTKQQVKNGTIVWQLPILSCAKGKYIEYACLLYTSPSPRDRTRSRMPSSA